MMNFEDPNKQAKQFLTFNGKLNAKIKKKIRDKFLYDVKKIYPFCLLFGEAVYLILKSDDPANEPFCKCGKLKKFHRYSDGYFKTCGKKNCKYCNRKAWNRGLTKENDKRIDSYSKTLSKSKKGKEQSSLQKKHLKLLAERNCGKKRNSEIFEKVKETCLKKYGEKSSLSLPENKKKARKALIDKFGGYYTHSKEFQENKDKIFEKMRRTNLEKYGFEFISQNPEIKEKIFKTKKKNKTLNSSKLEDYLYGKLHKQFEIDRHYKEVRYPFSCDYYFREFDLFVEINAHWTHGKEAFNKNNNEHLKILSDWEEKAITSSYFKKAIYVWVDLDVRKREISEKNNLDILFIYETDKNKILYRIRNYIFNKFYKNKFTLPETIDLKINYSREQLLKELYFLQKYHDYDQYYIAKSLILNFQSEGFFKEEYDLWRNENTRKKLVSNRIFYLKKSTNELSPLTILEGFRKSGIYKGYSYFSIGWIRYFIKKYGITSIYDPCGGWGHRYLGALDIRYIYADSDLKVLKGVKNLHNFILNNVESLPKKVFYHWDSSCNCPKEKYDTVFTCPPYYNLEKYFGKYDSVLKCPDYRSWLYVWWKNLIKECLKGRPKFFSFVISEKYKKDMLEICLSFDMDLIEDRRLIKPKSHFQKELDNSERLLIFSL